jgi:hypothetical protein
MQMYLKKDYLQYTGSFKVRWLPPDNSKSLFVCCIITFKGRFHDFSEL